MTILITGGAGYIGSHMVYKALEAGRDIVVADNLTTGRRDCLPSTVPFEQGDIGDEAFLEKLFGSYDITAIIHFAGSIVVPESVSDPLKYYRNNTAASRTLLEAAVAHGVRHMIFSSTAAVYGDPDEIPVSENAATAPLSPYGTSKLMTELMLQDTSQAHDFRYIALRYFNVAGADPKGRTGQSTPNATHLIKVACQAALGMRDSLSVFGTDYDTPDGTGVRDYIHVSDLVSAHLHALESLEAGGESGIYNCGYGEGFSVMDVIQAVKRASNVDFTVKIEGRRDGDSPKVVANSTALKERTKWQPDYDDLDTIVAHAFQWERLLLEAASQSDQ